MNENCHKLKMQYPYPVPFCKRYFSKNNIYNNGISHYNATKKNDAEQTCT